MYILSGQILVDVLELVKTIAKSAGRSPWLQILWAIAMVMAAFHTSEMFGDFRFAGYLDSWMWQHELIWGLVVVGKFYAAMIVGSSWLIARVHESLEYHEPTNCSLSF